MLDRGPIIAGDEAGVAVYRLTRMGTWPEALDPGRRVLVVEDDLALRGMFVTILVQEGYVVTVAGTLIEATTLLTQVSFDLVITDGFSESSKAVLTSVSEVLTLAGTAPTILFSAHEVELDDSKEAGLRDLMSKPFNVETVLAQIRALLD